MVPERDSKTQGIVKDEQGTSVEIISNREEAWRDSWQGLTLENEGFVSSCYRD